MLRCNMVDKEVKDRRRTDFRKQSLFKIGSIVQDRWFGRTASFPIHLLAFNGTENGVEFVGCGHLQQSDGLS